MEPTSSKCQFTNSKTYTHSAMFSKKTTFFAKKACHISHAVTFRQNCLHAAHALRIDEERSALRHGLCRIVFVSKHCGHGLMSDVLARQRERRYKVYPRVGPFSQEIWSIEMVSEATESRYWPGSLLVFFQILVVCISWLLLLSGLLAKTPLLRLYAAWQPWNLSATATCCCVVALSEVRRQLLSVLSSKDEDVD
jgi:hypothetical protein